jgi:capsular exopolysaccharide synthesis family protein
MSEIFDALQRRGAGVPGAEPEAPLHAFDVLRRAEQQVQERLDRPAGTDAGLAEVVGLEELLKQGAKATEPAPEPVAAVKPLPAGFEQSTASSKFQSIAASIAPDSHLVCVADADGPAAEAFRLLGVRLRDLRDTRALKRILITSTVPREGKSTVSANLACTLARSGRLRVLLLEGDVRRPTQSHIFGIGKHYPGLCEWLQGSHELAKCVYQVEFLGFWIMPAGNGQSSNPLGLLQPARLSAMLKQLGDQFDLIILDSPPVLPMADTSIWMKLADGILLVTRQGVTERRPLQRGIEAIDPQKLIGTVMNSSTSLSHSEYYYYGVGSSSESAARR